MHNEQTLETLSREHETKSAAAAQQEQQRRLCYWQNKHGVVFEVPTVIFLQSLTVHVELSEFLHKCMLIQKTSGETQPSQEERERESERNDVQTRKRHYRLCRSDQCIDAKIMKVLPSQSKVSDSEAECCPMCPAGFITSSDKRGVLSRNRGNGYRTDVNKKNKKK